MKIETTSKQIAGALQIVGPIVNGKHTVPILENVLVTILDGIMYFTADNLEVRSTVKIPVTAKESLSVCVPYDLFSRIVKGLPDAPVTLEFKKKSLNISFAAGMGDYNIPTVESAEFPKRHAEEFENSLKVDGLELAEALEKSVSFVDDSSQEVIKDLVLRTDKNSLTVWGMARPAGIESRLQVSCEVPAEILLSKSAAISIKNVLRSDEEITLSWSDNKMVIKGEDVDMTVVLSAGKYPAYEKLFPEEKENTFHIVHDEIMPSIKRVTGLADKDFKKIVLSFSKGSLTLSHSNTSFKHDAKETIKISYDGETIERGFDATLLKILLSNFPQDSKMYLSTNPKRACIIESDNVRGLLAPFG